MFTYSHYNFVVNFVCTTSHDMPPIFNSDRDFHPYDTKY